MSAGEGNSIKGMSASYQLTAPWSDRRHTNRRSICYWRCTCVVLPTGFADQRYSSLLCSSRATHGSVALSCLQLGMPVKRKSSPSTPRHRRLTAARKLRCIPALWRLLPAWRGMNELFEVKITYMTLEEDILRNGQPVLIMCDDHTQSYIQQQCGEFWDQYTLNGKLIISRVGRSHEHGSTEEACWR